MQYAYAGNAGMHSPEPEPEVRNYDYIVVGAGTAGSVIAARLSEDVDTRVLLIEAGAEAALPEMELPGIWPLLLSTSASWGESTTVQAFSGTSIDAPRGRALGGSSSINGLNFLRGHRSSYDAWVEQGAIGWGFDDLLPFFKRSETTVGRDSDLRGGPGRSALHPGCGGGREAVGPHHPGAVIPARRWVRLRSPRVVTYGS